MVNVYNKYHFVKNRIPLITLLGIVFLLFFYGHKLGTYKTVWELPDEAGYLWNAAFLSGKSWDSVANQPYYGYGYSLFLIPAFYLFTNGTNLIIYAHFLNILFDLGSYILLVVLAEKILCEKYRNFSPLLSILPIISPHIVGQTFEVTCESCLFFFYVLIIYEIYNLFEKETFIHYVLVSILLSFAFFIHTRAIGIIIAAWITIIFWNRFVVKAKIKKLLLALFLFLLLFGALYLVKMQLVDYKQILTSRNSTYSDSVENIINGNYIVQRIIWFINEPKIGYFCVFFIKILYSFFSTGGLLFWVLLDVFHIIKYKKCDSYSLTTVIAVLAWFTTIILCVASGLGVNATYTIYGRYYEHTLQLLTLFGAINYLSSHRTLKTLYLVLSLFLVISLSKLSIEWLNQRGFLTIDTVDNNRIAAIGCIVENYTSVYQIFTIIAVTVTVMIILMSINVSHIKILIFSIIALLFMSNSVSALAMTDMANRNSEADVELADYIMNSSCGMQLPILDDNSYIYFGYYSRLQVLLMNYELQIISYDEIPAFIENITDDYFIIYSTSPIKNNLPEGIKVLKKGRAFYLCGH